jgi:hypothetical protein
VWSAPGEHYWLHRLLLLLLLMCPTSSRVVNQQQQRQQQGEAAFPLLCLRKVSVATEACSKL